LSEADFITFTILAQNETTRSALKIEIFREALSGEKQARFNYSFSPRKSPPIPIGHLGEGAHKVLTYDSTLFLYYHIREFY
jgi:hypothetical protein